MRFLLGLAWPVAASSGIWSILAGVRLSDPAYHLFAGATGLWLCSTAVFSPRGLWMRVGAERWREALATILAAAIGAAGLAMAASHSASSLGPLLGAATFVAAASEEVVFRVQLPRWLSRVSRPFSMRPDLNWVLCSVAPQLSFALAHCVGPTWDLAAGPERLTGLFVLGLVFQAIVDAIGLWAAIAVHCGLNVAIASAGATPVRPPGHVLLLVVALIAAVVSRRVNTSKRERDRRRPVGATREPPRAIGLWSRRRFTGIFAPCRPSSRTASPPVSATGTSSNVSSVAAGWPRSISRRTSGMIAR